MSMFSALEISGSAMGAERQRAEVVATNMANAETTRTPSAGRFAASKWSSPGEITRRFSLRWPAFVA